MQGQAQELKLASFNAALGAAIRLNGILNECYRCKIVYNLQGWFDNLRALETEAWAKFSDPVRTEVEKRAKSIKEKLSTYNRFKGKKSKQVPQDLYDDLEVFEKFLRDKADEVHLIIPNKLSLKDTMGIV